MLRSDTWVGTFDIVMKGNAQTIDWVMDKCIESTTSPYKIDHDYAPPVWQDVTASGNTFKLLTVGAGTMGGNDTQVQRGCIGTGFTIGQSIDSDNGECVITMNCMTAYKNSTAGTVPTTPAVTFFTNPPFNIKDNDTYNINDGSAEDLMIYSWELSATRPVERIGARTYTGSQSPFGYAMTGAWEVTGSLSVKRDASMDGIKTSLYDGSPVAVNVGEAGVFEVNVAKAFLNGSTIDNGGSILKQTIPFTASVTSPTAGELFTITI